jgi:hypothetical protein
VLAAAIQASLREAAPATRPPPSRPTQAPAPPGVPLAQPGHGDELAAALQASLREQWRPAAPPPGDDDAELQAAIRASLAEQQRYKDINPWA